jgi:hypothetical protein
LLYYKQKAIVLQRQWGESTQKHVARETCVKQILLCKLRLDNLFLREAEYTYRMELLGSGNKVVGLSHIRDRN